MRLHADRQIARPGFTVLVEGLRKPAAATASDAAGEITDLASTGSSTVSDSQNHSTDPLPFQLQPLSMAVSASPSTTPWNCYRRDHRHHTAQFKVPDCLRVIDKLEKLSRSALSIKWNATSVADVSFARKVLKCEVRFKAFSREDTDEFSFNDIMKATMKVLDECDKGDNGI